MKKLALWMTSLTAMATAGSAIAATVDQSNAYQQAYALYVLYHPIAS